MSRATDIAIVAAGIAGLILLGKKQGFTMPEELPPKSPSPSPPFEFPPVGLVTVRGSIGAVRVAQAESGLPLLKAPGDTLDLNIDYTVRATRPDGTVVPWPIRFVIEFGHSTVFGWKTQRDLGFSGSGRRTLTLPAASGSGTQHAFFVMPDDVGVTWDIHFRFQAERSDSSGNPVSGDWVDLQPRHDINGVVKIVAAAVSVTGSTGTVSVAQDGIPPAVQIVLGPDPDQDKAFR